MSKKSFRDPVTNVLKAWGYVESNGDDTARDEPDEFNLEPGQWKFEGGQWVAYAGDVKATKLAAINAECDRRINAAVLSYPDTEVLTFAKQETEARAFLADALAATPMIDALATNRGIDKAELAGRIIAKADYFATYTGAVVGHRQKLEDQVNAPDADLDAIDPLAGWPA
jgi:hypothetical protein